MFRQNRLRIFDGRKTALMPVFSSLPALTATGISSSLCLFFRDLPRITHIGAIRFRVVFASAFRYPYHRSGVLIVRNHCRGWRCRRFRFRRRGRLWFWCRRRCIGLPCHRCRCCCRYRRRGKSRFRCRRRCRFRSRCRRRHSAVNHLASVFYLQSFIQIHLLKNLSAPVREHKINCLVVARMESGPEGHRVSLVIRTEEHARIQVAGIECQAKTVFAVSFRENEGFPFIHVEDVERSLLRSFFDERINTGLSAHRSFLVNGSEVPIHIYNTDSQSGLRRRARRRCWRWRRGRLYRRSRSRRRGRHFGNFFSQLCSFSQTRFRNAFFRFTHAFLFFSCFIVFIIFL